MNMYKRHRFRRGASHLISFPTRLGCTVDLASVNAGMSPRIKSVGQTQNFLRVHASISNLNILGRHLVSSEYYRDLRTCEFVNGVGQ